MMIDSGLPLVHALEFLGRDQQNTKLKSAITSLRKEIENGNNLADAMKVHSHIWGEAYITMVAAGEAGGILDTIFHRMSLYIAKMIRLKQILRAAIVYPMAALVIAMMAVGIVLKIAVPTLSIEPSPFLLNYSILTILFIGVLVLALRVCVKTQKGRYFIDSWLLRVPFWGSLHRRMGVVHFSRTMAMLVSSGVPILDCLDITSRSSGNTLFKEEISKVREAVEEGRTIVDPLRASTVFPTMVVQMIGIGEQAGALEQMLAKIADFYEEVLDTVGENLVTTLLPLMISTLVIVVAGMLFHLYSK